MIKNHKTQNFLSFWSGVFETLFAFTAKVDLIATMREWGEMCLILEGLAYWSRTSISLQNIIYSYCKIIFFIYFYFYLLLGSQNLFNFICFYLLSLFTRALKSLLQLYLIYWLLWFFVISHWFLWISGIYFPEFGHFYGFLIIFIDFCWFDIFIDFLFFIYFRGLRISSTIFLFIYFFYLLGPQNIFFTAEKVNKK